MEIARPRHVHRRSSHSPSSRSLYMMEARRWEDMNTDCLVNIFGRLDLESRVFDVPFVCKNWHRALSNPLCWQSLVFPEIFKPKLSYVLVRRNYNISGLIKFVVDQSHRCAKELVLPRYTTKADLIYVSDACASLKVLSLANVDLSNIVDDTLAKLIVKSKSLEILKLGRCYNLVQIIDEIGTHCKNFFGLYVSQSDIDNAVALAVVSKIQTIKLLVLDNNQIQKETLVLMLQGCKQLELLHVRRCHGFDEDDKEILNRASHIKDFCCDGSKTSLNDSDEGEDFYHYDDCGCGCISSDDDDGFNAGIYIDYYSL